MTQSSNQAQDIKTGNKGFNKIKRVSYLAMEYGGDEFDRQEMLGLFKQVGFNLTTNEDILYMQRHGMIKYTGLKKRREKRPVPCYKVTQKGQETLGFFLSEMEKLKEYIAN